MGLFQGLFPNSLVRPAHSYSDKSERLSVKTFKQDERGSPLFFGSIFRLIEIFVHK